MSPVIKSRSKGFTLIELMVVVFIIGILVAATLTIIPKVQRAVYGAQTSAQLSAIANAIQQYYNDFKAYPGPLPNNQLYWSADSIAGNQPNAAGFSLVGLAAYSQSSQTQYNPPTTATFGYTISGAQNLTLGLLGGLELTSSAGVVSGFVYNPLDLFADGVTPAPKGASSLNFNNPKRQQAYIQVKAGDISVPSQNYASGGAGFADEGGRVATPADAMIPVFLDKFSNPLPILYYRTNVGGTAIVGFRNLDAFPSGQPLVDSTLASVGSPPPEIAQYDLFQNLAYTKSMIGTVANNTDSYHGLQGLGTPGDFSDPIDTLKNGHSVPFTLVSGSKIGSNAIAYFKDPTLNPPYDSTVTALNQPRNTHLGVARQKDGFLLISAGPDRLYGTHDDVIYPGPLQP